MSTIAPLRPETIALAHSRQIPCATRPSAHAATGIVRACSHFGHRIRHCGACALISFLPSLAPSWRFGGKSNERENRPPGIDPSRDNLIARSGAEMTLG